jgi:hypothetical protein
MQIVAGLARSAARAAAIVCVCAVGQNADAMDTVQACAKYQTQDGWSHGYQVEAHVGYGSDLNQATGTLSYQPFSTYVVIFWAQNQASVIKLLMGFGTLTFMESEGIGQDGRHWRVSQSSGFCL